MEDKKILGRRLIVILLAVTMIFFLPVMVQSDVVQDHWNYYATYNFDLLESNARISAVRVVAHIDGTTVKVDTNLDDTPEYTFTLNEGDMWEMDLPTGTHIWSSKELTVHQYDDYQWDYKEVILPAVRYWGNDYYYGGITSRGLGTNYILITAAYDNTYVAIDLNNDGTSDLTNTLNEGQVWIYSKYATTFSGESFPGGYRVGYDTRAGTHIYTTTDNTFTTPGGNVIQVHAYAAMQYYFGSAYNIIPTVALGEEYIFPRVNCFTPSYWDRADKMIFVATEPSTTINIDHNHDGVSDVTINLANVGDWDYWPHGSIDDAWSHGAYVSANKAIATFYSSPGGGRYWDGFMSQMVPKLSVRSDYWNTNGFNTDRAWSTPYIHFFAYEDGTILYRDTNNDGTADFTYNLNFLDGGQQIVPSKEGEHFWVDDPDNHHVTMYQRLYYSASDTMSPISYQVNPCEYWIEITLPNNDEIFWIEAEPEPTMPTIDCRAKVVGITPDPTVSTEFSWSATIKYDYKELVFWPKPTHVEDRVFEQSFQEKNVIGGQWEPEFQNVIAGGKLRIEVKAIVSGEEYRDEVTVSIKARNPSNILVKNRLGKLIYQVICYKESRPKWHQFYPDDHPKVGLPVCSFDYGYGLMQITASPSIGDIWSWNHNIRTGRHRWDNEYIRSKENEGKEIDEKIKVGKPPYPKIDHLSKEQHEEAACYHYRAGYEYRYWLLNQIEDEWIWVVNPDAHSYGVDYAEDAMEIKDQVEAYKKALEEGQPLPLLPDGWGAFVDD